MFSRQERYLEFYINKVGKEELEEANGDFELAQQALDKRRDAHEKRERVATLIKEIYGGEEPDINLTQLFPEQKQVSQSTMLNRFIFINPSSISSRKVVDFLYEELVQTELKKPLEQISDVVTVKIGTVEQLTGLGQNQLRDWEDKGLLAPGRGEGRQREYPIHEIENAVVINYLKQNLGVSLESIGEFMNDVRAEAQRSE